MQQQSLIKTNDDASITKSSAVNKNYIQDEFIKYFVKRPTLCSPVINRGTYLRTSAVSHYTLEFLNKYQNQCQIVSLGAGYDTRYFLLKKQGKAPLKYFEVDLIQVTSKKAMTIAKNAALKELIGDFKLGLGGSELYGSDYFLVSGDLKQFDSVESHLQELGLDKSIPTLFISECFLIYLTRQESDHILRQIQLHFKDACMLVYEQILPSDAFGSMMIRNLAERDITLYSIHDFPDLDSQKKRYLDLGWKNVDAFDLNLFWNTFIDKIEQSRVKKCEFLDEIEEYTLFGSHYFILFAYSSSN